MTQLAAWGSKWAVNKSKVVGLGDNVNALLRLTFFWRNTQALLTQYHFAHCHSTLNSSSWFWSGRVDRVKCWGWTAAETETLRLELFMWTAKRHLPPVSSQDMLTFFFLPLTKIFKLCWPTLVVAVDNRPLFLFRWKNKQTNKSPLALKLVISYLLLLMLANANVS